MLVVDDNPFNILAFESVLSSLKVKSDCVYSGRSAIEKMLNRLRYPCENDCKPYEVVFMDQEMPEMSGADTVIEIKKLQDRNLLPETKIAGCTAHQDEEELRYFKEAGIREFIKKPISVDAIRNFLDGKVPK